MLASCGVVSRSFVITKILIRKDGDYLKRNWSVELYCVATTLASSRCDT
jgi:hypothetical protein